MQLGFGECSKRREDPWKIVEEPRSSSGSCWAFLIKLVFELGSVDLPHGLVK